MAGFAKRLGLVDDFTIEVDLTKGEFVEKLNGIVAQGNGFRLSNGGEGAGHRRLIYKGIVEGDRFRIKRIRRFLDPHSNMATAEGNIRESNGWTRLDVKISGLTPLFLAFYYFLFFVYFGGIFYLMFKNHQVIFSAPVLIAQGIVMAAFPYIIMRRSVERLRYDLEREFFYLTKK